MKIRIKDLEAERKAQEEQDRLRDSCPYPVPNYIPFHGISCYREIETDNIYFDRNGEIQIIKMEGKV